jgi:hypothetical protein
MDIELTLDCSDFIKEYVEQHKQELEELRAKANALAFMGQWFIIGDVEYTEKRQQYATTSFPEPDVSPRIILYAFNEEDIQKAIQLCRELKMKIAVRTGGHQYCGYSSTAPVNMQLDLSETFTEYNYDSDKNVLRCGVSHALGDWAVQNNTNGIYLPMGMCAHVHLGGHVHTGGWGIVARSHGILADHVLAFDIILANGQKEHIVRPEAGKTTQHNDDVYYAVLGGGRGGDFGIVTHWEFRPIRDENPPKSMCYSFLWLWSKEKMEAAVRRMEELSKLCANRTVPSDYEFMLTITGYGWMNMFSDEIKTAITMRAVRDGMRAHDGISLPLPPMIQMWMCYTHKDPNKQFDDQWFESFVSAVGTPLVAHRNNMPVSEGITKYFIMRQDREMDYPFVKRARVSMDLPNGFAEKYTERMYEIMSFPTSLCQHLVSQMQIYAGGAVAENDKAGITAYSWRKQAFAMGHDNFYSDDWFCGDERANAEQWQKQNDEVFIGQKAFADADMRMFAYTFGERELEKVWPYFYDSQEKYERLRRIKGQLDPDGLFSADEFSLKPL